MFPEGNSSFPEGTFLTLQDGESNGLYYGAKLHKSFDRGQTNTSIQWSFSRHKISKERQKIWKNPYEQKLRRYVPGY